MEQTTEANVEVLAVPFTGTGDVTVNKEKIECALPTLDDMRAAMADDTHAQTIHGYFVQALSAFMRNNSKAKRRQPASFEGILVAKATAAKSKGGNGAALLVNRACKADFKAYLENTLGVPTAKAAKITSLFGSVAQLETTAPAVREKIQAVTAAWSATLDDNDAMAYATHIERVELAGADESDLLSDF